MWLNTYLQALQNVDEFGQFGGRCLGLDSGAQLRGKTRKSFIVIRTIDGKESISVQTNRNIIMRRYDQHITHDPIVGVGDATDCQ
jgi:hypothetical protein